MKNPVEVGHDLLGFRELQEVLDILTETGWGLEHCLKSEAHDDYGRKTCEPIEKVFDMSFENKRGHFLLSISLFLFSGSLHFSLDRPETADSRHILRQARKSG